MPNRSETFGRLLSGAINSIAIYEGRSTPVVEEELGSLLNLSGKTIQRYKGGYRPPEERSIEILAEAAIQRGYLGREWLQRFLHAARYPFADKLLDRLCPIGPARLRPPRIYHNLPAPTYSQFVMRTEAFAEVWEGLSKQSAIVLIVGLGGNGKTSLAREVAARCLKDDNDVSRFDTIVWISDKDRPGTSNLSVVLDEIACVLNYPGFTQFAHDEKLYEVGQLLRRQRVLIVVDNFETVTDTALLAWLQNLPEPSKAMITTREYHREFRRSGWLVELRGMADAEAQALIFERLRVLRIEKLVSDPAQIEPLVAATGGNPKAIELALGLVKYERRPLQQVVDDLYAARGELFDDLFSRSWALLDEAARCVLLVMTFFPVSTSSAALSVTADVQGFAFDRAIDRLTDLALLDVQQEDLNNSPRFTLHPLVRAFAGAHIGDVAAFARPARQRWIQWYIDFTNYIGYCWDNNSKLDLLEPERDTTAAVIAWAVQHNQHSAIIRLSRGTFYYYFIRGYWNKACDVALCAANSARQIDDTIELVWNLVIYIHLRARQGDYTSVQQHLAELEVWANVTPLPPDIFSEYKWAVACYWMAQQRYAQAEVELRQAMERPLTVHPRIVVAEFLAISLYRQDKLNEARGMFQLALDDAMNGKSVLDELFIQIYLARIDLDQADLSAAHERLESCQQLLLQYHDQESIALWNYTYARLHILRGDISAARVALTEAIDLFERIGMRRELAEDRAAMADLDDHEVAQMIA